MWFLEKVGFVGSMWMKKRVHVEVQRLKATSQGDPVLPHLQWPTISSIPNRGCSRRRPITAFVKGFQPALCIRAHTSEMPEAVFFPRPLEGITTLELAQYPINYSVPPPCHLLNPKYIKDIAKLSLLGAFAILLPSLPSTWFK